MTKIATPGQQYVDLHVDRLRVIPAQSVRQFSSTLIRWNSSAEHSYRLLFFQLLEIYRHQFRFQRIFWNRFGSWRHWIDELTIPGDWSFTTRTWTVAQVRTRWYMKLKEDEGQPRPRRRSPRSYSLVHSAYTVFVTLRTRYIPSNVTFPSISTPGPWVYEEGSPSACSLCLGPSRDNSRVIDVGIQSNQPGNKGLVKLNTPHYKPILPQVSKIKKVQSHHHLFIKKSPAQKDMRIVYVCGEDEAIPSPISGRRSFPLSGFFDARSSPEVCCKVTWLLWEDLELVE